MDGPFVVRFAIVSGLAALAVVLLRDGLTGGGAAIGIIALAGIVGLARVVIAAERGRQERS